MEEVDGGYGLQRLGNLDGRCRMIGLYKDVDMIGHDFNLLQFPSIYCTRLSNDAFQFDSNGICQYSVAILRPPNAVVSEREYGMVA